MPAALVTLFLLGASAGDLVFVDCDVRDAAAAPWIEGMTILHTESDCFLALSGATAPAGVDWNVIDVAPVDPDSYRILYRAMCRSAMPSLPGEVVLETERFMLIRLASPDRGLVTVPGVGILRPLRPAVACPEATAPEPAMVDTALVADIAAAVDGDSLNAFISHMQSYGTRYATSPEYDACADWADTWMSTHWIPSEQQYFDYGGYQICNVEAEIPGVEFPERIYIICAHLDSYCAEPSTAPGADDDGSGSATVMEAARVMAQYQFRNTVRFVLFTAEEFWMVGSEYYVQQAYEAGEDIRGAINLDMILWAPGDPDSVFIPYDAASEDLALAAGEAFAEYAPSIFPRIVYDPGAPSDHASFWQYGYDAIEMAEGSADEIWGGYNPYYHQPEDLLLNYMPSFPYGTDVARAAVALLATLAEPLGPSSVEGGGAPIDGDIIVSPNPCTSGSLRILVPEGLQPGAVLSVVDLAGRIVAETGSVGPGELVLDLGTLPGGVYSVVCPGAGAAPARFVLLD